MKRKVIHFRYFFIVFLFKGLISYCQNSTITINVGIGKIEKSCQGQIQRISLQQMQAYYYPKDVYYKRVGESCVVDLDEVKSNNSLKWEGAGIEIIEQGFDHRNYPYILAKINETGKIKVSWSSTYHYPATTDCNPSLPARTITYESIGIAANETFYIPKPPKPIISVPNSILIAPESTILRVPKCPNTLLGQTTYPNMNVWGQNIWGFDCSPDGTPVFSPLLGDTAVNFAPQTPAYRPSVTFYCKCDDNGCESDLSEPLSMVVKQKPTYDDCDNAKNAIMRYIDSETLKINRRDYHYYSTETKVCSKVSSNCTIENVFQTLLSNVNNTVPNGDDIENCLEFEEKAGLAHSKSLYPTNDPNLPLPVENCQEISIPRPDNMVWLAAIASTVICEPFGILSTSHDDPVFVSIDYNSKCITNYTMLGHTFYPGKVTRCLIDNSCEISMLTVGSGITSAGDNYCGEKLSKINSKKGVCIFKEVDKRFLRNLKSH